jgi:hypothetical protein
MKKLVVFFFFSCVAVVMGTNNITASDCNATHIANPVAGTITTFLIEAFLPSGELYIGGDLEFHLDLQTSVITPESNGAYHVAFAVYKAGPFSLSVYLHNEHIQGSPFALVCQPGELSPSHSLATGALTRGDADTPQTISLLLQDAFGNVVLGGSNHVVSVHMTTTDHIVHPVTQLEDLGNGTILIHYNMHAGAYITDISVDGIPILGSPFETVVSSPLFVTRLRRGELSHAEAFGVALAVLVLVALLVGSIWLLWRKSATKAAPMSEMATTTRKQEYQSVGEQDLDNVDLET